MARSLLHLFRENFCEITTRYSFAPFSPEEAITMAGSKRRYEQPTIVDLGSIADHTFTCDADGWPPKGGGIVAHCDKFNEWSGGSGEEGSPNEGTCNCENPYYQKNN